MPPVTFIRANVPIYAAGREHRYREPCIRVLAIVNDNPDAFVTGAEVLREIMHHSCNTCRVVPLSKTLSVLASARSSNGRACKIPA